MRLLQAVRCFFCVPVVVVDPELTGTMIVQCTCGKSLGAKPCLPRFHGEVSHGICPACRTAILAGLAASKAARQQLEAAR